MQAGRTIRRIIFIAVAVAVLAPVAIVGIFIARFDPNAYKPQIIAQFDRLTHRQLSIQGKLRMSLSLVPTISATGITLANPPGYPSAAFVTLKRIEARVALLPLLSHRLNILKLVLVDPVINLEYGPTGEPDWLIDHPTPAATAPAAGATGPSPSPSPSTPRSGGAARGSQAAIALQSVSIVNGTVNYRPPASLAPLSPGIAVQAAPKPTVLHIGQFTGSADSLDSPLHVDIAAQYDGTPFTISGTTGPVSRLTGAQARGGGGSGDWPVDLTVSGNGASLHVAGSITYPRHASGFALKLDATIPDLSDIAPYLPPSASGLALPPLRDVSLRARVGDPLAGAMPAISDVHITAGQSDLGSWRKGLTINSLNLTLPALDQALDIALSGQYEGRPLGLEGKVGPLAPIIEAATGAAPATTGAASQPQERFSVNLAAKVGDAMFSVVGGIATPAKLAGVALRLNATVPNLANLSDLAGMRLPAWTNIGVSGLLTDPGGQGLEHAVGMNSLAISSSEAQIGGAFSLRLGQTPDLQAVIHIPRMDLSALLAAMPAPQPAQATPAPAGGTATPAAAATPAPAAGTNTPAGNGMVIPDSQLPFNLLRAADGNVELTIDQLKYRNAEYDAVAAHGLLQKGVLTVRPISAELPGGPVKATLRIDAMANPPTLHVTENAPAFRLGPMLSLFGQPEAASATMQLYANLKSAGRTPHDIAGNLDGTLGISTVNGEIDGKVLDHLLADTGLPGGLLGTEGPIAVRCFAGRFDAKSGVVRLRALTLDSDRLFMTGSGTINLGTEGLNLLFMPQTSVTGSNTPIPFAVTGTLGHPSTNIAKPQAYGAALSQLGQRAGGGAGTILGNIARQLGIAPQPEAARSCTGALTLARLGHPGPAPQGTTSAGAAGTAGGRSSSSTGPQNLLQSLFH